MEKSLKLILSLLLISIPFLSFSQDEIGATKWESEVDAYEKADSISTPPIAGIVFTGSSSIRLWNDLPQKFPGKKVINRGIGGSELSDINHYADRLIIKYKPKKVFIYCGGNDIANGKTPETVLNDFKKLYGTIKASLPNAKIYYISIQTAPVRTQFESANKRSNELIKAYLSNHTQDFFIDVSTLLMDKNNKPKPEFFIEDQLHMNASGYERWERVLRSSVVQ